MLIYIVPPGGSVAGWAAIAEQLQDTGRAAAAGQTAAATVCESAARLIKCWLIKPSCQRWYHQQCHLQPNNRQIEGR